MLKWFLIFSIFAGLAWSDENDFSHKYHMVEEELECDECHHQVYESPSLKKLESWTVQSCADCHEEPDPVYDAGYQFDLTDTSFQIPYRAPHGTLIFSHKQHIDKEISCEECHGEVDKLKIIEEDFQIMKDCMDCHTKKADNSCTACHFEVRKPANHKMAIWEKAEGHGWESNIQGEECSTCHHENNSCTACHLGATAKEIHPPNYRWTHGVDVMFKTSDCSVCHQPENQFCGDCHSPEVGQ